ncbi:sigma factor [Paenibacillus radicis (ex Xue et al. 2023)]|nr:sigma factor [Paenibacillus radicis (ex Xue et al. 2023)]
MEIPETKLFQELFYTHYPTVRRKLIALVRDEAAAEDLAQEVFLRLYRNPPDDLNVVGAWLHRVLTRIGYDHLNKKSR